MKNPAFHSTEDLFSTPFGPAEGAPRRASAIPPRPPVDDALERALSGHSREFLRANRQTGGE